MSGIAILHLYKIGDDMVVAMSQRRRDDEQRFVMSLVFRHVPVSVSAEEFGQALLATLDESAALPPTDADPKERYKQWQRAIAGEVGCKSWRAFRQTATLVDVLRYENGKVQITPAAHEGTGFMLLHDKLETLHDPPAEQLGTATKSAFQNVG